MNERLQKILEKKKFGNIETKNKEIEEIEKVEEKIEKPTTFKKVVNSIQRTFSTKPLEPKENIKENLEKKEMQKNDENKVVLSKKEYEQFKQMQQNQRILMNKHNSEERKKETEKINNTLKKAVESGFVHKNDKMQQSNLKKSLLENFDETNSKITEFNEQKKQENNKINIIPTMSELAQKISTKVMGI